ncbi:MAG: TolC family protein [Gemmataceae bacterium]|nr:TolC family protein [Gemmataceae bacterium]
MAIESPHRISDCFLPNGANLTDGLTEEEAVLIALWNNAAFQETLIELGLAQADLVQAGLLPNPEMIYFFQVPDKPFKYAIEVPLEAFWLRPIRVAAAHRETERVCERLTQAGLDLIRDARQAYADVLLAHGRLSVADDAVRIRTEIARLANARLQAGDVGEQEVATARIDALAATQDRTRIRYDVALAEERLRNVLGIGILREPIRLIDDRLPAAGAFDPGSLTAEALASRPDAVAATHAVDAAAERLRLAQLVWFRVLGVADASSGRNTGHELGPAVRFVLPIFNWNQGNVARAEAELTRAERQQITLRDRIILEVHQSADRVAQARSELEILVKQVRPEAETAIRRAEVAYREGNAPYVVVLETTRQVLDSRLRQAQLEAELRRAWAELERSVGRHIVPEAKP